ncbi:MAG: flagellar hook-basal body complex protein FliE [Alphaproteobacteria bacterium]|nr:flagellar hook-basal body complex protein FliE [Alphaproteobacteria bacterium]
MTSINNALAAYQTALNRISSQTSSNTPQMTSAAESNFTHVLKNVVDEAVDAQKQAEITTINGIKGQADIQDVVLAIANAEQALETVVAVRDTAIRAYNSIMQMNI